MSGEGDVLGGLSEPEIAALERVRDEGFPGYSLAQVARKLIRDDLIRQGVLPLGTVVGQFEIRGRT